MSLSIMYGEECIYSGSYGRFRAFQIALARAAGLPPLLLMEGYFLIDTVECNPFACHILKKGSRAHMVVEDLPIRWNCLAYRPIFELLYGEEKSIRSTVLSDLADDLVSIDFPLSDDNSEEFENLKWKLIRGMGEAYEDMIDLEFI